MGLGGLAGTIREQSKAAIASATTQFFWQDPSLSTESSRQEKLSAYISVLGVAGSSPGRTSYPKPWLWPPKWVFVLLWGRKPPGTRKPKKYCRMGSRPSFPFSLFKNAHWYFCFWYFSQEKRQEKNDTSSRRSRSRSSTIFGPKAGNLVEIF